MFRRRQVSAAERAAETEMNRNGVLSDRQHNRRTILRWGGTGGTLLGIFGVGEHLIDRGETLSRSFGDTLETIGPLIERALPTIDAVQEACGKVSPHLGDLDELRTALIGIYDALPNNKRSKKDPPHGSASTTIPTTSTIPTTLPPGSVSPVSEEATTNSQSTSIPQNQAGN